MKRIISLTLSVLILVSACFFTPAYAAEETGGTGTGTTYYVDNTSGDDINDGMSQATPWQTLDKVNKTDFQPGDTILLKRGETWNEQLAPISSGTKDSPIRISSYGDENAPRPKIAPAGGVNGLTGGAVLLHNLEYIEVSDLEVTNQGDTNADRSGIRIWGDNGETLDHIYVSNCYVHDVNGVEGQTLEKELYENTDRVTGDYKVTHRNGGINMFADNFTNPTTKFDDVRITHNEIRDCKPNGISTINPGAGWETVEQYNTNTYIGYNYIKNVSRSGIILLFDDGGLVEHNTIDTFQTLPNGYGCAIWHGRVRNNITQFNEARNGQGTSDGMAWNCDNASYGSIVQYNYSHDNAGGWIMMHSTKYGNEGNIFRYNLSVNDGGPLITAITEKKDMGATNKNLIYNNTVYSERATNLENYSDRGSRRRPNLAYSNNIFYTTNKNIKFATEASCTYRNNLFYGADLDGVPANNFADDPQFVMAGCPGSSEMGRDAYRLRVDSPCIAAGVPIEKNECDDLWGNSILPGERPNIGAYNGEPLVVKGDGEAIQLECEELEYEPDETVNVITDKNTQRKMVKLDGQKGDFIEFTVSLTAEQAGKYQVQTVYKDGSAKGKFQLAIDEKDTGAEADQYGGGQSFPAADHGTCQLTAGDHTFRYTVTGKNPNSSGFILVFDHIILQPIPEVVEPEPDPKPEPEPEPEPEPDPDRPTRPSGGGSSSRPSYTTTETSKNPDGSTTTTVTNRKTGTVTATTKFKDGSTLAVETQKDGTVTTTETAGNGVRVSTVAAPGKDITARVTIPRTVDRASVTIPANTNHGTVAVDAKTGEVVKLSVPTKGGITVNLDHSAELVLVDLVKDFDDTDGHWAENAIDFVSTHGLFSGTGKTVFSPDSPMTRGMIAVVLHSFDNDSEHTFAGHFQDVAPNAWYEDSVYWMAEKGIASGYGNGRFGVNDNISREQLASILYRYAAEKGFDVTGRTDLSRFADSADVSGYAAEALSWAVDAGLISGTGGNMLAPQGEATRAQVATILMRFVEHILA